MESAGKILREARISRGLTFMEVEKETSIRKKYLEAVENDDYDVVPGDVFVRGIIRTYGNYLGLNGPELVDMYKAARTGSGVANVKSQGIREVSSVQMNISLKSEKPAVAGGSSTGSSLSSLMQFALGLLAVLVMAGGYFILPQMMAPKPPAPAPVAATMQEAAAKAQEHTADPIPLIPPRHSDSVTIEMAASGQCWLEVNSDGQEVFAGMLRAGDKRTYDAKDRLVVKYGNVGVMQVSVNGIPQDLQGEQGVVIKTYTRQTE